MHVRVDYIYNNSENRRLLLVFNGWSVPVPPAVDTPQVVADYDIAVVSGYDSFVLPQLPREYDEVVLLAWSLGVHAAEIALKQTSLPLTLTVAVNGTPFPVDDSRGIPEAVFRATAEQLTEQSLARFRRRMGAPAMERGPRPLEELRRELIEFPTEPVEFRWDRAVISKADRIFPPENQRRAWEGKAEIFETEGTHMADFRDIVERFIINKRHVGSRFARGSSTYADEASVQARIADHLWQLWQKHRHGATGGTVLEFGVGAGTLTALYAPEVRPDELILWDIAPGSNKFAPVLSADAEAEISRLVDCSVDAVVSASTMQWFNSQPRFLEQVARVLRPGGLAVLSTFGPATFEELTACGVTPLPYLPEESLRRAALRSGLEILELHGGVTRKIFATPMDALRHLRATGVNGRPSPVGVREIERRWPRRADGRVSLTFAPIYLILKKQ